MNINQQGYLDIIGQINLDDLHIQQVFDFYEQQYEKSEVAQAFVLSQCLITNEFGEHSSIGYCDRTLGRSIPKRQTTQGALIRGSLQRHGLIRASGHELFRGCVIVCSHDDNGNVISATGYRIGRIRNGDKSIIYWDKPSPNAFVDAGMNYAKVLINDKTYH